MASIYRNGTLYWLKLRHPVDGKERRISLQTGSRSLAELLKRKWEAGVEFYRPEIQGISFPKSLQAMVPAHWDPGSGSAQAVPNSGKPLGTLLQEFITWCRSANDPKHASSKAAIVRAAFGEEVLEGGTPDGPLAVTHLQHLTSAQVLAFVEARPGRKGEKLADSSKRHYKELFDQLWNYALRDGCVVPANLAYPNPMVFLPGWGKDAHEIIFLTGTEIDEQLAVLQPFPTLHAAAATMIYAGVRRSEGLWLTQESIKQTKDERYLSVRKVSDGNTRQSLKTQGSIRPVTLVAILDAHVPGLKSK